VLEGDAAPLVDRESNFLLIANASGPLGFKVAWTTFLPLMAEPLALVWVKSILCGNGHTAQHRMVAVEFIDPSRIVVAHISADRWNVVEDGPEAPDPTILARAKRASEWLQPTPGLTPATTEMSADAATVLFPLVKGRIGSLIQRGPGLHLAQPATGRHPGSFFVRGLEGGRVVGRRSPFGTRPRQRMPQLGRSSIP
jgi:hypothetical protein